MPVEDVVEVELAKTQHDAHDNPVAMGSRHV